MLYILCSIVLFRIILLAEGFIKKYTEKSNISSIIQIKGLYLQGVI